MNSTKMITSIIVSATFTAASLAGVFYLFQKNTSASGPLGSESNFAFLGIIFGILYGSVIGGISGGVITGFQLNFLKAILFGLVFNLILGLGLAVILGADWNEKIIYDFLLPTLVGMVNAMIVWSFSSMGRNLK